MLEESLKICRSLYRSLFLISIVIISFAATIETFHYANVALQALRIINAVSAGVNEEKAPATASLPAQAQKLANEDPGIASAVRAFYAPFEDDPSEEGSFSGAELFPVTTCAPPINGSVYDWKTFIGASFPVLALEVPERRMRRAVEATLLSDHLHTLDATYENDSLRVHQQTLPECDLYDRLHFARSERPCGYIQGEITVNGSRGYYYGGGPQAAEVCGAWKEVGRIKGIEWFNPEHPARVEKLEEFSDSVTGWSGWDGISRLGVSQAIEELEIQREKSERGLSIVGITVNGAWASLLGIGAITILAAVLYGHLRHLRKVVAAARASNIAHFPWLALFPSGAIDITNGLVLIAIPVFAQIFLLYKTIDEVTLAVSIAPLVGFGLVIGWLNFRLLAMIRRM